MAVPGLAAGATQCTLGGFEQPCRAGDGEYRVLVPDGDGPFPAMVYLYGSGGRSAEITANPIFDAAVTGRGYALVVPTATDLTYVGGRRDTGWRLEGEPGAGRDDAAFVRAVIADAARRFNLDRHRILLAGQSRGGFLVWQIACRQPDTVSAYAAHGAGWLGPLPERCAAPVRFLQTQGASDSLVPIAGLKRLEGNLALPPMDAALGLIARTDGCDPAPGQAVAFRNFQRFSWSGCTAGSRLDLLLHPGGHALPAIWFRAALDWFEEPLPAPVEISPVVRRIGEGLPGVGVGAGTDTHATLKAGAAPTGRRFKAPPAPGSPALGAPALGVQ